MPDVCMKRQLTLAEIDDEQVLDLVQDTVAKHMSCWVPSKENEGYKFYAMDARNEIDVDLGFINGRSAKKILMVVEAYPYEDRLRNLKERIASIAKAVAELYRIDPDDVSITFRPVGFDCWTTGAGR